MKRRFSKRDWPCMTDGQRKLVEDNHGLIYRFLHDYNLSIDEWYDVAAIGICQASIEYDPSKAKFSSLAYRCMRNEVFHTMRIQKAESHYPSMQPVSLDSTAPDSDKEMINAILCETDFSVAEADEIMSKLTERQQKDLRLYMHGYTMREIGSLYGQSHGAYNEERREMRKRLIRARMVETEAAVCGT